MKKEKKTLDKNRNQVVEGSFIDWEKQFRIDFQHLKQMDIDEIVARIKHLPDQSTGDHKCSHLEVKSLSSGKERCLLCGEIINKIHFKGG